MRMEPRWQGSRGWNVVVALHGYVDGYLEISIGFEMEILVVSRLYLCRQLEVCLV